MTIGSWNQTLGSLAPRGLSFLLLLVGLISPIESEAIYNLILPNHEHSPVSLHIPSFFSLSSSLAIPETHDHFLTRCPSL